MNRALPTVLTLATLLGSSACGSPVQQTAPAGNQRGARSAALDQAMTADREPPPANGAASGGAHASGDGGVARVDRPPPLPLTDNDFSESDRTRDPFRSFAREFIPVGPDVPLDEHVIKLRELSLEQLQLIAVILGTENPYAMVVDSQGAGTIIRRGDYVGRPETIAGGDGMMAHQVPWRVARIIGSRVTRDADNNLTEVPGEVVFEREDRLNPNAPRAERVLTLSPGSQATRPSDTSSNPGPMLPSLPNFGPGSPFLPSSSSSSVVPGRGGAGPTYVQSYTQVVPPQPAQAAPPTQVTIQTGPQGEMNIAPPGQQQGANGASPSGGQAPANTPPPQRTNAPPNIPLYDGPTTPEPALPTSGLSGH